MFIELARHIFVLRNKIRNLENNIVLLEAESLKWKSQYTFAIELKERSQEMLTLEFKKREEEVNAQKEKYEQQLEHFKLMKYVMFIIIIIINLRM
jgi:hypothetical protein